MLDPEKQVKHRFFTEKIQRVRFWTEKFTTCDFWEWKNLGIWEESVFEFEKKYVLAAKKTFAYRKSRFESFYSKSEQSDFELGKFCIVF